MPAGPSEAEGHWMCWAVGTACCTPGHRAGPGGTRAAAECGERGPGVASPPGGRVLGRGPQGAGGTRQQRAAGECLREEF